jgi:DNA invertase Pin-like site-specific DNA recombinase
MKQPKGTRTYATRLNEAERAQIVVWRHEDVSQVEIAARLGCDRNTILRQQKKLGLEGYRRVIDDEARRDILKLHEQGLSARAIARQTTIDDRRVLNVLRQNGIEIKVCRRLPPEKLAAIDAEIRGRKDFLCRIAKRYGVGVETVRRRKKQILGSAPLKSTWPPLQSKFGQIDAAEYVPSVEQTFLILVRKVIDSVADKYLQQGRDRDEVLAAKRALKSNPTPVLEIFDAGLRRAAESLDLAEMTRGWTVH